MIFHEVGCSSSLLLLLLPLYYKRDNGPSARCASSANTLSMDSGLFNERSLLVTNLLYIDIIEYITTCKKYYAVVRLLIFHMNCGFGVGGILVTDLKLFCTFFLLFSFFFK
jgi:hypothetical protein